MRRLRHAHNVRLPVAGVIKLPLSGYQEAEKAPIAWRYPVPGVRQARELLAPGGSFAAEIAAIHIEIEPLRKAVRPMRALT